MRITRRSPRVKFGNTTYTFGKEGVSLSTKIGKHTRIGTTADGHRYISSRFLFWRIYQDLDELDYDASHGNLQNENPFNSSSNLSQDEECEKKQQIQAAREQRKNELSFWLLVSHPFVFFDHFFRKNESQKQTKQIKQTNQKQIPNGASRTFSQNQNYQNEKSKDSIYQVEIFKDYGGNVKKVTDGKLTLKDNRIVISANVEKEIFYRDISDVFCDKSRIFVSSKGRNIPLIVESARTREIMSEILERVKK